MSIIIDLLGQFYFFRFALAPLLLLTGSPEPVASGFRFRLVLFVEDAGESLFIRATGESVPSEVEATSSRNAKGSRAASSAVGGCRAASAMIGSPGGFVKS